MSTADTFTIYVQEKIGIKMMHSILFDGYHRVSDIQEDAHHIYNIKFNDELKQFEVYKLSDELQRWVLVYRARSFSIVALAIHMGMIAFRRLDLAKIQTILEDTHELPDIEKLPKIEGD